MVEKTADNGGHILTEEETEIYDRQIRLWGVEAQQRLRKAKILLVGLSGLGNEIAKNILLAGIQHLTMLDDSVITEGDASLQFLAPQSSVGKNKAEASFGRAKKLNPLVEIIVDTESITNKNESFLSNFDVVCMTGCNSEVQTKVNNMCHKLGVKFLSGNTFGYYGYMFADLGEHTFMEEKVRVLKAKEGANCSKDGVESEGPTSAKKSKKDANEEVEYEEKTTNFCTLEEALAYPLFEGLSRNQAKQISKTYLIMRIVEEYHKQNEQYPSEARSNNELEQILDVRNEVFEKLKIDNELLNDEFTANCAGTFYPVNAIVGGVMAQEIIKAVSGKDTPHNNFFFYDGVTTNGVVQNVSNDLRKGKGVEEKSKSHAKVVSEEIVL